ncbi:prepilin-type N-terminal cleavage/methylation domain-containing protein [Luteimonas cucumeris]|uniref:Prepilin-type N-terminal cleavage/methylation domain-containing protein n=1 Tax=Luteimonas cucumeris TaxID=985012 RepID=A0A562LF35_9GAMM|nr:prepilin-type N-terminal cleavage/methylation domain-containing protein [Luteimonas cucumeris]TWI06218.1 prepilin-type N-terminal cleavage/methylation domain-containing protein [Luteimonas cucumeris]
MTARIDHRQRGFSLVELAVVLVVLGLVTLLLVRFLGTAAHEQREVASRSLLTRADDALLAYAMVNSRLPCPDSDGGGIEDCAAGQVGRLPYKTLGLPDANARRIRYGVLRRPASRREDADLTDKRDRYDPLQVIGETGTELPLNPATANGLDLCWALRNAGQLPLDTGYLHVTRAAASSQPEAHVAYALALPRGGGDFSSHQSGSTPAFDSPRRPQGPTYHDRVLAVGLDQLWTRMRCGDNLAAAGHAHFNAAASIALMHVAMKDYKKQLAISVKLAEANVANGAGAVLAGASATAGAAGGIADTIAEGLLTFGAVATYKVALASVATAAAVAVTITASVMTGYADSALTAAEQAYEDVDPRIDEAAALEPQVLEHAKTGDAAGLY